MSKRQSSRRVHLALTSGKGELARVKGSGKRTATRAGLMLVHQGARPIWNRAVRGGHKMLAAHDAGYEFLDFTKEVAEETTLRDGKKTSSDEGGLGRSLG